MAFTPFWGGNFSGEPLADFSSSYNHLGSVQTMELALATANYLHPIADALVYINTTKVHPVWFPYAIAPTLHAARISIIYQSNARRSPSALSWGTYITGYLIMVCTLRPSSTVLVGTQLLQCWGGGLLSHFLLGVPPPMLYSFGPAINYLTVHLFVTLFFQYFPDVCITLSNHDIGN